MKKYFCPKHRLWVHVRTAALTSTNMPMNHVLEIRKIMYTPEYYIQVGCKGCNLHGRVIMMLKRDMKKKVASHGALTRGSSKRAGQLKSVLTIHCVTPPISTARLLQNIHIPRKVLNDMLLTKTRLSPNTQTATCSWTFDILTFTFVVVLAFLDGLVARKPVFGISDQVRQKPCCTAT